MKLLSRDYLRAEIVRIRQLLRFRMDHVHDADYLRVLDELDNCRHTLERIQDILGAIELPRTPMEWDALTAEGQKLVGVQGALRDLYTEEARDER